MTYFILQTCLLLLFAFVFGASIGCMVRSFFLHGEDRVAASGVVGPTAQTGDEIAAAIPAATGAESDHGPGETEASDSTEFNEPVAAPDPVEAGTGQTVVEEPESIEVTETVEGRDDDEPSGHVGDLAGAAVAGAAALAASRATDTDEPAPEPEPQPEPEPEPEPEQEFPIAPGSAPADTVSELAGPAPTPEPAAPPVPTPAPIAAGGPADDLSRIQGIDDALQETLDGLGVSRFDQIAAWTSDDVKRVGQEIGDTSRISRQSWIEQAAILAGGGQTLFTKRIESGAVRTVSEARTPVATALAEVIEPAPAPEPEAPPDSALDSPAPTADQPEVGEEGVGEPMPVPTGNIEATKFAPSDVDLLTVPETAEGEAEAIVPAPEPEPEPAVPDDAGDEARSEGSRAASLAAASAAAAAAAAGAALVRPDQAEERGGPDVADAGEGDGDAVSEPAELPKSTAGSDEPGPEPVPPSEPEPVTDDLSAAAPATTPDAVDGGADDGTEDAALAGDMFEAGRQRTQGLRSVRSEALAGGAAATALAGGGGGQVLRSDEPDDLKRVRGIGVVIEKKLNAMGITRYAQVAAWTETDIEEISRRLDFKGRIERENWIEQARILADSGQTDFSRRLDRGEVDPNDEA